MKVGNTHLAAELPVPEAGELVALAVKTGIPLAVLIGYHVMRSAFGVLHPIVAEFEASHRGTLLDEKKRESER
jgi:hypothetical protein